MKFRLGEELENLENGILLSMTKNLLITGDSFCAVRNKWPLQFCGLLGNHSLYGTGFSGCSWWSVRKEIIEYLKIKNNIHTLVVLHTEPYRMPSDNDLPLNSAATKIATKIGDPYIEAIKGYYKYLISEPFHLWAYFNWFQELEVIISNSSLEKVVHLYCFPGPWTRYVFKKGITIQKDILSWSKRSKKDLVSDDEKYSIYPNHLSLEDNELFAKRLHEVFTTRYQDSVGITDF